MLETTDGLWLQLLGADAEQARPDEDRHRPRHSASPGGAPRNPIAREAIDDGVWLVGDAVGLVSG